MGSMNVRFEEQRDGKNIIWVTGCPKSGTTWISRLLGEATGSKVGGPFDTAVDRYRNPPATEETHDRDDGPLWIFQEHLSVRPDTETIKYVHIVRDPRDIAVSAWYYWNQESLAIALERVYTSKWPYCYRWNNIQEHWIVDGNADSWLRYEDLLLDPASELYRVICDVGIDRYADMTACMVASERHEIGKRRAYAEKYGDKLNLGKDHQLRMLRKGISGDWKNHFNRELAKQAHDQFFPLMKFLGYEENEDWWESVPE